MRILAGTWKARVLKTHEGKDVTRPSTSRIRESMMSMIAHQMNLDLSSAQVFDAFAGSGALGFELLSRGAQSLIATEKNRRTFACLSENARALKAQNTQLICGDVLAPSLVTRIITPSNVLLLDPPYAYEASQISSFIACLSAAQLLLDEALVMYEHTRSEMLESRDVSAYELELLKEKVHGSTRLSLYRYTIQKGDIHD